MHKFNNVKIEELEIVSEFLEIIINEYKKMKEKIDRRISMKKLLRRIKQDDNNRNDTK